MKPTPPNWPRISSSLYYEDAAKAIDWLCKAFGFTVQLKIEGDGGRIEHSELRYGEGLVMVGDAKADKFKWRRAPTQVDGVNTQNMFMYVDDVEAHCKQAREAGAVIEVEPYDTDYGAEYWADRTYQARDIGGHHWWIAQRMSTGGK